MIDKTEEVRAYNRAVGKEAGKALLFFSVGIPAFIFVIALLLVS